MWAILVLIVIGVVVIVALNQYFQPEFGSQMGQFAGELHQGTANFPYVGNMNTQVYYKRGDPRIKDIPSDAWVGFKNEQVARDEYHYTPAP